MVNPDTGASRLIGAMGVDYVTEIVISRMGKLYACTFTDFYAVDRISGRATLIGPLGASRMVGLDFASNGTLYGVGQDAGGFFHIDPSSGLATLMFNTPYSYIGDVAHYRGSLFYATASVGGESHLIEIEASAAMATDLGLILPAVHVPGLDFTRDGRLLAFAVGGEVIAIPNFTSSGAGMLLSNTGVAMAGATMLPAMLTAGPNRPVGMEKSDGFRSSSIPAVFRAASYDPQPEGTRLRQLCAPANVLFAVTEYFQWMPVG
jgi:hypothetical protein